jgi:cellobiose phosphorylase
MDHGVWPYLTLRQYINRSADLKILLKKTGYFKDHQLRRAQDWDPDFNQADFIQRDRFGTPLAGTILEHILIQNVCQFFNVGRHNIVKLENADWNDGLDMAPDHGESVAFSCMYAHNLADICNFLKALKQKRDSVTIMKELVLLFDTLKDPIDYDSYKAKQKRLSLYFDAIERASGTFVSIPIDKLIFDLQAKSSHMSKWISQHEWLKEGFFNGYYDNKAGRVEGKHSGRITMMLAPQVFAIMSGVADVKQIRRTWGSIQKRLKDQYLGGFRLNTDLRQPALDLGRAYGFAFGDKENGAFFSHMNIMLAYALYERGHIEEGAEVMDSVYRMASSEAALIPPVLPEYFNSQARGLYLYLTGSASWYIHTLIEEVLGITYKMGDIVLTPKLMASNFKLNTIKVQSRYHKREFKFIFHRLFPGKGPYCLKHAIVNGKTLYPRDNSLLIPASHLTSLRNTVDITLQ